MAKPEWAERKGVEVTESMSKAEIEMLPYIVDTTDLF